MAVGEQVAEGGPDELLSFAPLEDGNGLEIVDHIERRRCTIKTIHPIQPRTASTSQFAFPIDEAFTIETDELVIPHRNAVCVRNSIGWMVDELSKGDCRSFPRDEYSLELPLHIKLYLKFTDSCNIEVADKAVLIELGSPQEITIGVRSHHKHPAGTIVTTTDINEMMWAVSQLGSALKTTSCERSYPTLRGHPPAIEIGDTVIEDPNISTPKTGVKLQIPPDYQSLFVSAPLSFYLGAVVEPSEEPQIVTENGFVHTLQTGSGFEEDVEQILKQIFFLDCVTRTEGLYQVALYEREAIENNVRLEFGELYDQPLQDQLEYYLDVSYEDIRRYIPDWKLTALIKPHPENIENIPFLLNDLAIIRTPQLQGGRTMAEGREVVNDFPRNPVTSVGVESASVPQLVRVDNCDSMEQTWIGEGAPLGASKGIIEAFRNRLGRRPSNQEIEITVVCNDGNMSAERDTVNEIYGSREELPFDVSIHRQTTADELERILHSDTDFLHYIGHIDAGGFECVDSRLDAVSLDYTGVDTFFLNACTSYRQGIGLIKAGAIAGVVTLQDIINSGAERVGKTLARLLNHGFPLRAALNLAKTQSIMGGHYLVIGDGSIDVAQPEGSFPALSHLQRMGEEWQLKYTSYLTQENAIGSIIVPFVDENERYHIASGESGEFLLDNDELLSFLSRETMPVMLDNELLWSDGLIENLDL